MDLTAEQLEQNWQTLLAKINNNFSGERKDLFLSADEALELGIIDLIG